MSGNPPKIGIQMETAYKEYQAALLALKAMTEGITVDSIDALNQYGARRQETEKLLNGNAGAVYILLQKDDSIKELLQQYKHLGDFDKFATELAEQEPEDTKENLDSILKLAKGLTEMGIHQKADDLVDNAYLLLRKVHAGLHTYQLSDKDKSRFARELMVARQEPFSYSSSKETSQLRQ